MNAGRDFKTVDPGKRLALREARPQESLALLADADASPLLDPVSKSQVLACMSSCQLALGDEAGAAATLQRAPVPDAARA